MSQMEIAQPRNRNTAVKSSALIILLMRDRGTDLSSAFVLLKFWIEEVQNLLDLNVTPMLR
jgi:hypothetical protein